MILALLLILISFSIILTAVWLWFFKNEKAFCKKLYSAGLLALEAANHKKAKAYFSKINFIIPNFNDTSYRLGLAFLNLGEYVRAVECFEGFLKISPKHFDSLLHLAIAFQSLGEDIKAEDAYSKALKEDPESGDCLFGLGFICYRQKKYKEAIEFFEKARETFTDKVKLAFYLNKCNDELSSNYDDSQTKNIIEAYLEIANESNLPSEFNISLATAYAKAGMISSALDYCKRSLVDNPEDIESYKLLGLIQLVQMDFVATKNTISTALHLQPKNEELHNILSYVLCQQIENCTLDKCRERYYEMIKQFLN